MNYEPIILPDPTVGAWVIWLFLGVAIVSFFLACWQSATSHRNAKQIGFGILAVAIIVASFGAILFLATQDQLNRSEAYGKYREARIEQIRDTYGLKLTPAQFAELQYPVLTAPLPSSDEPIFYGEVKLPVGKETLGAKVVTLAWTGEEMVLLGSPEGADFEELPRIAE